MTISHVLEAINAAFAVLSMCALCIFMNFIWHQRKAGYIQLRPAIALACMFLGEAIQRSIFWYVRDRINSGNPTPVPDNLVVMASLVIIVGICCAIRIFSPSSWGNRGWIFSLMLTIIVVTCTLSNNWR